jgi:Protein of unknown function (DUF669)
MHYVPNTPGVGTAFPDGEYQFEVTNAEEKTSNTSGNDMIELTLKIKDGPTVYDYLVNVEESLWKLDNFRASTGEEVKPGVPVDINPEDFIGPSGTCLLYTDTYQGKKKNKVADYVFVIAGPGAVKQPLSSKDKWR